MLLKASCCRLHTITIHAILLFSKCDPNLNVDIRRKKAKALASSWTLKLLMVEGYNCEKLKKMLCLLEYPTN